MSTRYLKLADTPIQIPDIVLVLNPHERSILYSTKTSEETKEEFKEKGKLLLEAKNKAQNVNDEIYNGLKTQDNNAYNAYKVYRKNNPGKSHPLLKSKISNSEYYIRMGDDNRKIYNEIGNIPVKDMFLRLTLTPKTQQLFYNMTPETQQQFLTKYNKNPLPPPLVELKDTNVLPPFPPSPPLDNVDKIFANRLGLDDPKLTEELKQLDDAKLNQVRANNRRINEAYRKDSVNITNSGDSPVDESNIKLELSDDESYTIRQDELNQRPTGLKTKPKSKDAIIQHVVGKSATISQDELNHRSTGLKTKPKSKDAIIQHVDNKMVKQIVIGLINERDNAVETEQEKEQEQEKDQFNDEIRNKIIFELIKEQDNAVEQEQEQEQEQFNDEIMNTIIFELIKEQDNEVVKEPELDKCDIIKHIMIELINNKDNQEIISSTSIVDTETDVIPQTYPSYELTEDIKTAIEKCQTSHPTSGLNADGHPVSILNGKCVYIDDEEGSDKGSADEDSDEEDSDEEDSDEEDSDEEELDREILDFIIKDIINMNPIQV